MNLIINFVMDSLSSVWNVVSASWILSSVVIISLINLVASIVIHTMGRNK